MVDAWRPLHQDPGGPLLVAAVVLPLVDRAAPDREVVEHHVEELEPPVLADHAATVSEGGSPPDSIAGGLMSFRGSISGIADED